MKNNSTKFFARVAMIAVLMVMAFVEVAKADPVTLVSGSGTSDYAVPDGWTSSGTVAGGGYLKFDNGTITSPAFEPHTGLSFAYSVACFGTGTNHPLTIRILNASTDAVIVEKTTATPTSSSYINTNSPLSLGDVNVSFKIQLYAPTGKGIRLRNYSVTGTLASGNPLETSDLALTGAPVALSFDLYNNSTPQAVVYTTSSTGAVTVSGGAGYVTTSVNTGTKTITVTPTAVTPSAQTITVNQAADATYASGSATFTVSIADSTPFAGGDVTFDATRETGTTPLVKNGVSFACDNGVLNNGSEYRLYKNSTTTFSTSSGVITNVEFTGVSGNPASGFASQAGWTTNGNNGSWAGSATSVSFVASGAQVRATQIVVTVDLSGSPDPSISADNVNIAYDVTSGGISYTINNIPSPEGTLTASRTSGDWLTVGAVGGSSVAFTCSANSGKERTASVRLTYTYGSEQTVTKDVTITQAANPEALDLISEITSAGTYRVQGTIVAMNSRGFIVGDGTGYVYYYYGNGFNPGSYSVGSMVNLYGSVVVYGGVFEFNNTTTINAAATSNYSSEEPTVLTGTEMDTRVGSNTAQLSTYVQYQGILSVEDTHYNITSIGGASTAVGSISYPSNTDFTTLDGSLVTVKGYYVGVSSSKYYNTMIGSVEAVAVPTVAVSSSAINVDASGVSGILTVSYENFSLGAADVYFYESDGSTSASYDWISASINGDNNVAYTINGNPGDSRIAYFKVYAIDTGSNEYYSGLITVTQNGASYSYATLPFDFDGGKSLIATTNGLSQTGLGSDYGSSPYLKFDSEGDELVLSINETPGVLSFNIKGNSFSGGVFTVKASVDGSVYTDIASYDNLGATENVVINNLATNVRFIKWVYTTKGSGNVALGNISLAKPASAPATFVINGAINDGNYWASFYSNDARYTLPEGAKAFTLNSSKQLYLLGEDGRVVPANTAVIIMANSNTITLTKSNDASDISIKGGGNILIGSDTPVSVYSISGKPYVLGIVGGELGFYRFTGTGIPANKAYYVVNE